MCSNGKGKFYFLINFIGVALVNIIWEILGQFVNNVNQGSYHH